MDRTHRDLEPANIAASFEHWGKQLQQQVAQLQDEPALQVMEQQVRCEGQGWPINSGPMESDCKQLGLRLQARGRRWNENNVTPMAALVTWWSPPISGKARAA